MQPNTFNQQLLRSCIEDPASFSAKYSYFKAQYQQANQEWIHKSIRIFKSILMDNQSSPIRKMQTLKAIKEGLDTCIYGFMTLVEVEVLPIFMDIARYRKEDFDQNRGRSLFLVGLRSPKERQEAESIGNNYLRIILECIQVWAKVKPYHIIEEYIELQDLDSEWMRALKQLKSDNVTFPQQLLFFTPEDIQKLRKSFVEQSDNLSNSMERYVEYYRYLLYDGLEQERNFHNDNTQHLIKLYRYGDAFLLNDGLKYIGYNLTEQNVSPMKKILSLRMLNQLFKSGQFNIIQFTNQLSPRLVDIIFHLDTNDVSLRRGEFMFKGDGGKKYGHIYYSELLKSLQLWGACVPNDALGRNTPSEFVLGIQKLKEQKRLQFPKISSSEFSMFKEEFSRNQKRNELKNQMLREIENDIEFETPGSLKTTSVASKHPNQSSLINRANRKLSSTLIFPLPHFQAQNFNEKNQTLRQIYYQIDQLKPLNEAQNRQWLNESMRYIQKYCQMNPSMMVGSGENTRAIIDDLDKAEKILGVYQRYNDQKISYSQLLNSIKSIHKGSYISFVQPNDAEQLKYEMHQAQQKQELQKIILKSREEIIPIHVSSLNTANHDSHDMTVNRTAHFLPVIPSTTNIRENYVEPQPLPSVTQTYSHQQQVFIPNPTPFTSLPKPPTQPPPSIQTISYTSPSNYSLPHNPNNLPRMEEYGLRRQEDEPSSKENMSINKKQQRSESWSDAVRSKQKIVIEGFEQNLLDSKLSLLNKEESERRIQSSMSLKNLNITNKSGSLNFNHIPPSAMPPRSLSPPIPKHPSYQQPPQIIQRDIFPKNENRQYSKSSTPIKEIIGQETINYTPKEQDSKIIQPFLQPLNNSYHEMAGMKIETGRTLDFKAAFQSNKYYIGDNIRPPNKIWLEKQAILLRSNHQNVGNVNVPKALSELELYHSGQVVNLEQHYQKIIQTLESKISSLEYQLQESRQNNLHLEKELDSYKGSMAYSRPLTDRTVRDSSLKVSRYNSHSPLKRSSKEPQGKKISQEPYRHLFMIKQTSIKKTMLKNKDLLLKNSYLEIGFMASKEDNLKITLFVLPFWNLENFRMRLNNPGNLKIQMSSAHLGSSLQAQKQYKYILEMDTPYINMFPLRIAELEIQFQQSHTRSLTSYSIKVPGCINRFFDYNPVQDINSFNYLFENPSIIHTTQQHLLNTRIIKQPNALLSLLPKFRLITPSNSLELGGDLVYGAEAYFNSLRFFVRCVIRPNNSLYWQAMDQSQSCPQKLIHQYLATMLWLLSH